MLFFLLNQQYNLAHEENLTLKQFIDLVSEILQINYNYCVIDGFGKSYYPSVSFGPVSIEKAKKHLNWKPALLKSGIELSVKFFLNEGRKYKKEYEKMIKDLPSEIRKLLK